MLLDKGRFVAVLTLLSRRCYVAPPLELISWSWVRGQQIWMSHVGHGSVRLTQWPMTH